MTQAEIGQPVPRIDVEALIARLCDPRTELALLDVREEGQFGMGHMLWAVNAPYSRLEAVVPSLVPRHASMIVLVDAGDNVAQRAASRLRSLGYLQVFALDGGIHAWEAAGHPVFQGVYVPGKVLGEWAEEHLETPSIDAVTLDRLQAEGAPLVVLDPRSEAEHAARHIPGALSCPNGEILLRFEALAPSYDTLIVVACGGRTRGIVGAQTLIDAGVGHRVVALADGNHGWQLAGLNLETGLRHKAPAPDFAQEEKARKRSLGIAQAQDVPAIDAAQLARWRTEDHRTTYVLDVRTPAEFARAIWRAHTTRLAANWSRPATAGLGRCTRGSCWWMTTASGPSSRRSGCAGWVGMPTPWHSMAAGRRGLNRWRARARRACRRTRRHVSIPPGATFSGLPLNWTSTKPERGLGRAVPRGAWAAARLTCWRTRPARRGQPGRAWTAPSRQRHLGRTSSCSPRTTAWRILPRQTCWIPSSMPVSSWYAAGKRAGKPPASRSRLPRRMR